MKTEERQYVDLYRKDPDTGNYYAIETGEAMATKKFTSAFTLSAWVGHDGEEPTYEDMLWAMKARVKEIQEGAGSMDSSTGFDVFLTRKNK